MYIERYNDVVYKIDRIQQENQTIKHKNEARKKQALDT